MSRQLTQYETKKLFHFCHQHYVYHYDVQLELVDHLASAIESQWEDDSELSFEKALRNTFRRFGITGFSRVKVETEKALRQKYNRLLWKYMLEFYRLPKIIMTLGITGILFSLVKIVENNMWILIPYLSILAVFLISYYYLVLPKKFKIRTKVGKSFLLLKQLERTQLSTLLATQLPIHLINFSNILKLSWINHNLGSLIVSLLLTTLTIALYGELIYIPKKIKAHFMQQFAEFAV